MNYLRSLSRPFSAKLLSRVSNNLFIPRQQFHATRYVQGFEEFYETKKANEPTVTGRAWTAADLRRKSFEDLHALWWVMYKERNLLLTDKEKCRRLGRPVLAADESRYQKVKRGMAAIMRVLDERSKIEQYLIEEKEREQAQQEQKEQQKQLSDKDGRKQLQ